MGSVFFGCLTATFRSVLALRYGVLPFLARSEMPRPIKILICKIGRGFQNDLSIYLIYLPIRLNPRRGHQTGSGEPSAVFFFTLFTKKSGNMAAFSVEGKKREKLEF